MGEIPELYERGDLCGNCWGEGKTFGDYPTPKSVYVTFEGLQPQGGIYTCPPNGTFILHQHPNFPCQFWYIKMITCEGRDHELWVHWEVEGSTSNLYAIWWEEIAWFEPATYGILCNDTFNNRDPLIGGTGKVH